MVFRRKVEVIAYVIFTGQLVLEVAVFAPGLLVHFVLVVIGWILEQSLVRGVLATESALLDEARAPSLTVLDCVVDTAGYLRLTLARLPK